MEILIKTKDLSKVLTGEVQTTLVHQANLEIHRGEFIVITGPSGSGKSSLLYLLGLLDRPTSGTIWLNNTDLSLCTEDTVADLRLAQIGFVFQFHFLLPEFTALENVMLPMRKRGVLSMPEMTVRAEKLLDDLGLKDQANKTPKKLSGGQAQRVAIARALANDPALILADEPTGNLDSISSENVQKILKDLTNDKTRTVIALTHDTNFAEKADRIIHIVDGKIVH